MKTYKIHFIEKESDITIISESKEAILRAKKELYFHRHILEKYIVKNKTFLTTFSPIKVNTKHLIINRMAQAASLCNVGPMATVAGALADLMMISMKNKEDLNYNPAKIALVENGGEIAVDSIKPMKVGLYAGKNELNLNIGFLVEEKDIPIGISTSSGTVGHAISFGEADSVTIFADNATIADGAATATCNLVKGSDVEKSIKKGLDHVEDIEGIGVRGAFISRNNMVGKVGKIPKLIKIEGNISKILNDKLESIFSDNFKIL